MRDEPAPPTGTVTFLFTDIEGSTRLWQDEPDLMRAALAEHDGLLREVIDQAQVPCARPTPGGRWAAPHGLQRYGPRAGVSSGEDEAMGLGRDDIGGSITVGSYEDREAIKDLYSRFALAADDDRFDDWADTFAPDGWMSSPSHPSGRVTGREDLSAMVSGNSAWLRDQGIVKQRHINANFRISVEGDEA